MAILVSPASFENLQNKYVLIDTDFLNELFRDEELFKTFGTIFSKGNVLIDPLIEFEFLRDIYELKQRKLRENFISLDLFGPVSNHFEIFQKLQENALLLSKVYAHQDKQNQRHRSSFVDLFLAARLMLWSQSVLLITGNKKDFPNSIFDMIGVLTSDKTNDGSIKTSALLEFNTTKFEHCLLDLEKIKG